MFVFLVKLISGKSLDKRQRQMQINQNAKHVHAYQYTSTLFLFAIYFTFASELPRFDNKVRRHTIIFCSEEIKI